MVIGIMIQCVRCLLWCVFFFFFSYISSPLGLVGMENAGTNMPTRSLRLVLPNMSHLCIATRYITITVVICFFFFFFMHMVQAVIYFLALMMDGGLSYRSC